MCVARRRRRDKSYQPWNFFPESHFTFFSISLFFYDAKSSRVFTAPIQSHDCWLIARHNTTKIIIRSHSPICSLKPQNRIQFNFHFHTPTSLTLSVAVCAPQQKSATVCTALSTTLPQSHNIDKIATLFFTRWNSTYYTRCRGDWELNSLGRGVRVLVNEMKWMVCKKKVLVRVENSGAIWMRFIAIWSTS